jgi:hypothetical protein
MADQFITCTTCHSQIPLTQALRADIEESLKRRFAAESAARERELQQAADTRMAAELERVRAEAVRNAERQTERDVALLRDQLAEQSQQLVEAREQELAVRRRERELERQREGLALTVARQMDEERQALIDETRGRLADEHRLKDAEKERQLADMRRQIEDLRRKADQGSSQLQGEAGEWQLEGVLREACRSDNITAVSQGVRGADIHHVVLDARGTRAGAILWECKNTRNWSDDWIPKLKQDQRSLHADVAVIVSATLRKGCDKFGVVDGVLVTDFACAAALATIVRLNLFHLAQLRQATISKEEKLELLYQYLSGVEFRQRVEAVVDAFTAMRHDLDQERRAAERQWARRSKQIDSVTFNISGMYGDLQGLLPALPSSALLELPEADEPLLTAAMTQNREIHRPE